MDYAQDRNESTPTREMPRYKYHKEVHALKIARIERSRHDGGDWILFPEDDSYGPICVDHTEFIKLGPEVGGYYIVYADGCRSYSPSKAFEAVYKLAEPNKR